MSNFHASPRHNPLPVEAISIHAQEAKLVPSCYRLLHLALNYREHLLKSHQQCCCVYNPNYINPNRKNHYCEMIHHILTHTRFQMLICAWKILMMASVQWIIHSSGAWNCCEICFKLSLRNNSNYFTSWNTKPNKIILRR